MTAIVEQPLAAFDASYGSGYSSSGKKIIDDAEKKKLIYETSYEPNLEWWTKNQAEYKPDAGNDPLPEGFPEQVSSPAVWDGKTLINRPEKWVYRFTSEDIKLIDEAYEHFQSLSISNDEISKDTFPIPADSELYKALGVAAKELREGLGFRVLRGLPVDLWTRVKQIVVFAGISSYIGPRRIVLGKNSITHLRDITNIDADKRPAIVVKGQTNGNQVFHNDGIVGVVSLITIGVAESGGLSQLSSIGQTYNDLAKNRRDILREVAKPNWVNKGHPEGRALFFPVGDNQIISSYSRRPYFGFYEANADVPPLPVEKHLALDALHFTAEKYSLDINLEKGDLEYANNFTVYHARTSSEDSEVNQRHLIRVWLANDEQELPEFLVDEVRGLGKGVTGGWPLEAWDD